MIAIPKYTTPEKTSFSDKDVMHKSVSDLTQFVIRVIVWLINWVNWYNAIISWSFLPIDTFETSKFFFKYLKCKISLYFHFHEVEYVIQVFSIPFENLVVYKDL